MDTKATEDFPFDEAEPLVAAQPAAPEAAAPFWTEAPCSINTHAVTAKGYKIQVTFRASTPEGIMAAFGAWAKQAERLGIVPEGATLQAPPAAQPAPVASTIPAASGNGNGAAPAPVMQPTAKQRETFTCEHMEIAPRPDGKADVKFFTAGHKWPDATGVWSPEMAVRMLSGTGGWTQAHFTQPGNYQMAGTVVEWEASDKLNSKGNPYKNIVRVFRQVAQQAA